MKAVVSFIIAIAIVVFGLIAYTLVHETIPAGYVGYIYDRTANEDDPVIPERP